MGNVAGIDIAIAIDTDNEQVGLCGGPARERGPLLPWTDMPESPMAKQRRQRPRRSSSLETQSTSPGLVQQAMNVSAAAAALVTAAAQAALVGVRQFRRTVAATTAPATTRAARTAKPRVKPGAGRKRNPRARPAA